MRGFAAAAWLALLVGHGAEALGRCARRESRREVLQALGVALAPCLAPLVVHADGAPAATAAVVEPAAEAPRVTDRVELTLTLRPGGEPQRLVIGLHAR
jgi:hypothetical protein